MWSAQCVTQKRDQLETRHSKLTKNFVKSYNGNKTQVYKTNPLNTRKKKCGKNIKRKYTTAKAARWYLIKTKETITFHANKKKMRREYTEKSKSSS